MVTMKDIAMLANVSQQAVSAVLNNSGSSRVSAEKRENILRLARELNYIPNAVARQLKGGRTRAIGLVASPGSTIHDLLHTELCNLLISKGFRPLTATLSGIDDDGMIPMQELMGRGIDGLLILNSVGSEALRRIATVPVVFASHHNRDGFDVGMDNECTGYIGTRHLVEHGHMRIGYLSPMSSDGDVRYAGYCRALEDRVKLRINLRDLEGRADKLAQKLRDEKITALFCSNDYTAAKVIRALPECGLRVPHDVAVVGCDGLSFTEFLDPGAATVLQPLHPVADRAVALLLERIDKNAVNMPFAHERIKPIFNANASCGCAPRSLENLYRINTTGSIEKDYMLNFNKPIFRKDAK